MSPYTKSAPYAGKYKSLPNPIIEVNKESNQSRLVFDTAPAGPITSSMMAELVDWYKVIYNYLHGL